MPYKVRINAVGAKNSVLANGAEALVIEEPSPLKGRDFYSVIGVHRRNGRRIGQWLSAGEFEKIEAEPAEVPSKAYKPVHGGYPG